MAVVESLTIVVESLTVCFVVESLTVFLAVKYLFIEFISFLFNNEAFNSSITEDLNIGFEFFV